VEKIRLLLVDRRELFREGLAKVMQGEPNIEVVGTCSTGPEAIEKASELKPDVVLMDTELPEGKCVEATNRICELLPETKVIMLTHSIESRDLFAAIKAGAQGYVTKDITVEDLLKAVALVIGGGTIIGAPLAQIMLKEFISLETEALSHAKHLEVLSKREREVLSLVAKGATNREISTALFISEHTVKVHLHNIMQKLHVHNRQQATALAVEDGVTPRIVKELEQ